MHDTSETHETFSNRGGIFCSHESNAVENVGSQCQSQETPLLFSFTEMLARDFFCGQAMSKLLRRQEFIYCFQHWRLDVKETQVDHVQSGTTFEHTECERPMAGALTETERMVASLWSHRIIVFGIGQGYELDIDEHDVHIRVYRGIE